MAAHDVFLEIRNRAKEDCTHGTMDSYGVASLREDCDECRLEDLAHGTNLIQRLIDQRNEPAVSSHSEEK